MIIKYQWTVKWINDYELSPLLSSVGFWLKRQNTEIRNVSSEVRIEHTVSFP